MAILKHIFKDLSSHALPSKTRQRSMDSPPPQSPHLPSLSPHHPTKRDSDTPSSPSRVKSIFSKHRKDKAAIPIPVPAAHLSDEERRRTVDVILRREAFGTRECRGRCQMEPSATAWIGVPHQGLNEYVERLAVYQFLAERGVKTMRIPSIPDFDVGKGVRGVGGKGEALHSADFEQWVIGNILSDGEEKGPVKESLGVDSKGVEGKGYSKEAVLTDSTSISSSKYSCETDEQAPAPATPTDTNQANHSNEDDALKKRDSVHNASSGRLPKPAQHFTDPQRSTIFARDAMHIILEQHIGLTTATIQYQHAQTYGWRLRHSEQVLCVPEFLALSDEARECIVRAKHHIAYANTESVSGGNGEKEISADSRLFLSLSRALAFSRWCCSSGDRGDHASSVFISAAADRPEGYEHDARACRCAVKTKDVLVCLVVGDSMRCEGDEIMVQKRHSGNKDRKERGKGKETLNLVLPLWRETFVWAAENPMELGRIAESAKQAVEQQAVGGFAATSGGNGWGRRST